MRILGVVPPEDIPNGMSAEEGIAIRETEVEAMVLAFLSVAAEENTTHELFAKLVKNFEGQLLGYILILSSLEYDRGKKDGLRTRRFRKKEDGKWHIEVELERRR